ncbi:DinB family protein [Salinibacter altiplanensis]|uniref:DinB family protein n=1 Tax=Salinibacter altiplanensis TaxID=1803181 RepID=UPI000C9F0792|nr:DinB family protein [Salinibacter altiplanensis]
MHTQLDEYRTGFVDLKNEATALVADVDAATMQRRPDTDTWSVVQCIDHLNTAGWLLLRSTEEEIQRGHDEGPYGEPPFEYGIVSRWFVHVLEPSSGWTFDAPSLFEPDAPNTLYPDEAIDEFLGLQDRLASCVEGAEGLDLRRIRFGSPAVPLLRISLGAWFEATLAHERRHLKQARRTLRAVHAS